MTALTTERAETLTNVILGDDGSVPIPAEAADSKFINKISNYSALFRVAEVERSQEGCP
jgi:hypothetical protein